MIKSLKVGKQKDLIVILVKATDKKISYSNSPFRLLQVGVGQPRSTNL